MKVTVRKLAEMAGVSPATVSRYLNASESVSLALADQIDKALITLGGTPAVRQSQKRMVLVLLTHLRFDFYSQTLAELLSQEPEGNWALALLRYDPCHPELVHNFVNRNHPAGVIYFEEEMDQQILSYLQKCGLRTVMCGGTAVDRQSDGFMSMILRQPMRGLAISWIWDTGAFYFSQTTSGRLARDFSALQVAAGLWRNRDWFFQKNRYCAVALLSAMAMTPCGARCQRDSALQQFLHSVTSWRWVPWRHCTMREYGYRKMCRCWGMTIFPAPQGYVRH